MIEIVCCYVKTSNVIEINYWGCLTYWINNQQSSQMIHHHVPIRSLTEWKITKMCVGTKEIEVSLSFSANTWNGNNRDEGLDGNPFQTNTASYCSFPSTARYSILFLSWVNNSISLYDYFIISSGFVSRMIDFFMRIRAFCECRYRRRFISVNDSKGFSFIANRDGFCVAFWP